MDKTVVNKLIEVYHWFKYRYPFAGAVENTSIKEFYWSYNSVLIKGSLSTLVKHNKTYVGLVIHVTPYHGGDGTEFVSDFIKHMLSIYSDVMVDKDSGTPTLYWNS